MEIYLVGGAIRDELLGRPVKERDWVVVGAGPQVMENEGYRAVGRDFPVYLHPETGEEYALARTERKTGQGYHGFRFHADPDVSLEEDLLRRDFTINAMARDSSGQLIDPYGGQADLRARTLRHVSPAFAEDPVRILRGARFMARYQALGFRIAPETQTLMQDMVAQGEVEALVAERVWQETQKALAEDSPGAFFMVLRECGALEVLFPELDALFGVPQPAQSHPEIDTGVHSLMVLAQACVLSSEPETRFAALVHDLGKGQTPPEYWPRHHGHEARSVKLIEALCRRLRAPGRFLDLARHVARFHGNCHRAFELRPSTVLKILEATDAMRRPERFEQFLLACEADARGRTGYENKPYPQGKYFRQSLAAVRAVDAKDLVAKGFEGQQLGRELSRLRVGAIADLPLPEIDE